MTIDRIKQTVTAVLSTLAECDSGMPESHIYRALGTDLDGANQITRIMTGAELITISGNYIELTAKGRELGEQINAHLAKA